MSNALRIVLASGNAGKAKEFRRLLQNVWGSGLELLLQTDLGIESIEETGSTFMENALLKARHAARVCGLPSIADDSGLEVDALDGAPSVFSARFAGVGASDEENFRKLLAAMRDVPEQRRTARFRCVLAFIRNSDDLEPLIATGSWEGRIATSPRGQSGFGYDPVFVDAVSGLTAAEMSPDAKNSCSHRSQALLQLLEQLQAARL